ncbi:MAG TPA: hypothetical protein VFK15_10540 [Burkholderiales bacterium]|jgi:hypothetical protein|nr:hypothetical protein [Burkholderiales bacterium]
MSAALTSTPARRVPAWAYVLIEFVLPGGTLVALLLWLLQLYFREGFAGVRQYAHVPRMLKAKILARARPRKAAICRCLRQTVFLGARAGYFRQRCTSQSRMLVPSHSVNSMTLPSGSRI